MLINDIHSTELSSTIQTFKARVELYRGSTLEKICNCGEVLNDFTVERTGEGKFFGFGICQKLKTNLIDENKELNITKDHTIEVSFGVGSNYIYPFPVFYVDDVKRDEETEDLNVTAYDSLYRAEKHTVSEIDILQSQYTLETFLAACCQVLDIPYNISSITDGSFSLDFPTGANFNGDETIRQALNAIAEATQSIYFINNNWELTFKRLDKNGESVFTIDRGNYFDLKTSGERTLGAIVHTTQLEDSVTSIEPGETVEGETQYIRDNPFWDLREDIGDLVDNAQTIGSGISIEQFECDWFGNYLLEIGDKIKLISKDNRTLYTYFLDDSITYNGSIEQFTKWSYSKDDAETASNPTSLGEVLNKTFARVDKVAQEITLYSGKIDGVIAETAELKITTDTINNTVSGTVTDIDTLKEQVQTSITKDSFSITLQEELSNGVDKISTKEKKYTFDDTGLNISDSDSDITTKIDHNGMTISTGDTEGVLVANKDGVNAKNLKATTWLIIGDNCQIQSIGSDRTGCFWIGS